MHRLKVARLTILAYVTALLFALAVPVMALPMEPSVPYPRPASAFGLHDTPIIGGSEDVPRAIRDWQSLGVGWVTVLGPREDLMQAANAAGIQVVARIYSPSIYDEGPLVVVTKRVVASGMRFVVPFNEPNLTSEVAGRRPDPKDFAARWLHAADVIVQNGGAPVLTPLAPEGDYPDVPYFEDMLSEIVKARGAKWLSTVHAAVGVHAYILHLGDDFRERFVAYDEIVRRLTGGHLPMIATEAGVAPELADQDEVGAQRALVAMAEELRDGKVPDYVIGASLWLYSNRSQGGRDARFEDAAWFGALGPREVAMALLGDEGEAAPPLEVPPNGGSPLAR